MQAVLFEKQPVKVLFEKRLVDVPHISCFIVVTWALSLEIISLLLLDGAFLLLHV